MAGKEFRSRGSRALLLALTLMAAAGLALLWTRRPSAGDAADPGRARFAGVTPELRAGMAQTTLTEGVRSGHIAAQCTTNGRDTVRIALRNLRRDETVVEIPAGQVFESDSARVVAVRPRVATLTPGGAGETAVVTAALSASNHAGTAPCQPREEAVTQLAVFLPYLRKNPEASTAAIQTAVLALTENLPLSAFARFQLAAGASPGTPETQAFRVATREIVQALQLLKEIGYPMERLALNADPQLKVEAMVDPMAHADALRLHGIRPGEEWAFWKQHLLEGPPTTRHYALYGIARWFPSTALRMLPKWALQAELDPAYRTSAIRALAQTGTESALPVLRQLRLELDPTPVLATEVDTAIRDLEENLRNPARFVPPVPFRFTPPEIRDRSLVPD